MNDQTNEKVGATSMIETESKEGKEIQELIVLRGAILKYLPSHELYILYAALVVAQTCFKYHVLRNDLDLLQNGLRANHSNLLRLLLKTAETGNQKELECLLKQTEVILRTRN